MTKWSPQRHISEHDYRTSKAPALANFNNELYMVWRGNGSDNLWFGYSDGESWSENRQIANNATSEAPALAEYNGKLYLAYLRDPSDNKICALFRVE